MSDSDEAELAAQRLELALDRIAASQAAPDPSLPGGGASRPPIDPRITVKLDNLIRALRTALEH